MGTCGLVGVCAAWILVLGPSSRMLLAQLDRHAAVLCTSGAISTLLLARIAVARRGPPPRTDSPPRSLTTTTGWIWSLVSTVGLIVAVVWLEYDA
jgi:hypothetical protein